MTDHLVFKYVTADRIDVLKDCRIRFTQPSALNDPFEALPSLTHYNNHQRLKLEAKARELWGDEAARATGPARQDMLNVFADDLPRILGALFAFLSVSQIQDNLLMWSHYAGNHTGFVIGFNAGDPFFAPGRFSEGGLQAIKYTETRFSLPATGLAHLTADEMRTANEGILLTKSSAWAYEREMRMLASPRRADKTIPGESPICLFNFPSASVRRVILGARMAMNTREEIAGLIEEKYSGVGLWQAVIDPDTYALNFVPYSAFIKEYQRLSLVREITKCKVVFHGDEAKKTSIN